MSFGIVKEQERFRQVFPKLVQHHDALEKTTDRIFERDLGPANKIDRTIFALGLICGEDFQQAYVLCSNGFGIGALQIVRGMYERHVTAAYLVKYPQEVENFLAYHHIHRYKDLVHLKQMYSAEKLNDLVPISRQKEIEQNYQTRRDQFATTKCEKCNTTRPMMSWSKLDLATMAKKADSDLAQNYYADYYRPTMMSHATMTSILSRMIKEGEHSYAIGVEGQRTAVPEALIAAHKLLLFVLDLQNRHFKLGLDREIDARRAEFLECWIKKPVSSAEA
jgi:hypothetical protein